MNFKIEVKTPYSIKEANKKQSEKEWGSDDTLYTDNFSSLTVGELVRCYSKLNNQEQDETKSRSYLLHQNDPIGKKEELFEYLLKRTEYSFAKSC